MEIKSTIKIILNDLKDARDLIDDLKNYEGVPHFQIELAKAKCRSAEELMKLLVEFPDEYFNHTAEKSSPEIKNDTETSVENTEKKMLKEEKAEEAVPEEAKPEEASLAEAAAEEATLESKDEVKIPETENNEDSQEDKIKKVVDEIVSFGDNEPSEKAPAKGQKIVADRFSHLSNRINEQIADRQKGEKNSNNIVRPISDLKKAIGINDRFLFIRELFNGDKDKYAEVIDSLNNVDSLADAENIIKRSIKKGYEEDPYEQLIDLVKRKLTIPKNG
jgi:hypothetical protein